jgi:CheY-like chemotaxis protein
MQTTKSPRILYAEDDRDLAVLVEERLSQAGIIADLAYDGTEALAKFIEGNYDLVALDQTLPGLDGLGVLRAIAALGPLPPTVMVTGTGSERIAVETMKLGADDYIIKDLDGGWLDLLPDVIRRVLDHRHLIEGKRIAEAALREKEQQLAPLQNVEAGPYVPTAQQANWPFEVRPSLLAGLPEGLDAGKDGGVGLVRRLFTHTAWQVTTCFLLRGSGWASCGPGGCNHSEFASPLLLRSNSAARLECHQTAATHETRSQRAQRAT